MQEKIRYIFLSLYILLPIGCIAQTIALQDSLSLLRRLVDCYPDSIPLRYEKASLNMRMEQWLYAQDEYTEILNRQPNEAEALYYRAHAYERQGQYGFARADYQRFLTMKPGNANGMVGLALVSKKQGRKIEAMEWLNRAITTNPDKAVGYVIRGNFEMDEASVINNKNSKKSKRKKAKGELERAEFDFAKAVELEPENIDYLLLHTEVLIRLGRKIDAQERLRQLIILGVPPSALEGFIERCK